MPGGTGRLEARAERSAKVLGLDLGGYVTQTNRQGDTVDTPFILLGLALKLGCCFLILMPFVLIILAGVRYFAPKSGATPAVAVASGASPSPSPANFEAFPGFSAEESRQILEGMNSSLRAFNRGDGRAFFAWHRGPVYPTPEQAFENCYHSSLRQKIGVIDYFILESPRTSFAVTEEDESFPKLGLPKQFRRGGIHFLLHGSVGNAVDSVSLMNFGDSWQPSQQLIEGFGAFPQHSAAQEFRL